MNVVAVFFFVGMAMWTIGNAVARDLLYREGLVPLDSRLLAEKVSKIGLGVFVVSAVLLAVGLWVQA